MKAKSFLPYFIRITVVSEKLRLFILLCFLLVIPIGAVTQGWSFPLTFQSSDCPDVPEVVSYINMVLAENANIPYPERAQCESQRGKVSSVGKSYQWSDGQVVHTCVIRFICGPCTGSDMIEKKNPSESGIPEVSTYYGYNGYPIFTDQPSREVSNWLKFNVDFRNFIKIPDELKGDINPGSADAGSIYGNQIQKFIENLKRGDAVDLTRPSIVTDKPVPSLKDNSINDDRDVVKLLITPEEQKLRDLDVQAREDFPRIFINTDWIHLNEKDGISGDSPPEKTLDESELKDIIDRVDRRLELLKKIEDGTPLSPEELDFMTSGMRGPDGNLPPITVELLFPSENSSDDLFPPCDQNGNPIPTENIVQNHFYYDDDQEGAEFGTSPLDFLFPMDDFRPLSPANEFFQRPSQIEVNLPKVIDINDYIFRVSQNILDKYRWGP